MSDGIDAPRMAWPIHVVVDGLVHEVGSIDRRAESDTPADPALVGVPVRLLCECNMLVGFGVAWTSTTSPEQLYPFRVLSRTSEDVTCMACIASRVRT